MTFQQLSCAQSSVCVFLTASIACIILTAASITWVMSIVAASVMGGVVSLVGVLYEMGTAKSQSHNKCETRMIFSWHGLHWTLLNYLHIYYIYIFFYEYLENWMVQSFFSYSCSIEVGPFALSVSRYINIIFSFMVLLRL